ncbi:DUF1653 domain-containing protein [Nonomuraea sp. SMC257]|uniref:DUF1653 domain-containing protein n=1 Tax=Nonomuraea montanisoli TaxID=2741721 RepID=A0A7Y6IF81_9ACTN|nr:DUF1653 domain-containing protein [Nonomuraea montanisoli]NUW37167.1 DUF1653 domain-containing protein [Nonomuraea montanisoli]
MGDHGIKPGVYEHFSGNRYQVIGFGHGVEGTGADEQVGEEVVVYQALFDSPAYGDRHIWVRGVKNFTEHIEVAGQRVERFRYVGEATDE